MPRTVMIAVPADDDEPVPRSEGRLRTSSPSALERLQPSMLVGAEIPALGSRDLSGRRGPASMPDGP